MNGLTKKKLGKDGRTVAKNFGYLSVLQMASYAFPLLTMPYLSRVIGVEGFGKIAFASAVIVWVTTVADWGFNYTATRDIAQNRENKDAVSAIFSNVLWARMFLVVFSGVCLKLVIEFYDVFKENESILWATFLLVPGHVLFPEWMFQGLEKMKYTTIFNISIKLLFTIAVFVFIKDKDDYILQPFLNALGFCACGIISIYIIIGKWKYKLYRPNFKQIYSTIANSTDVFINNLMPNLYNSFSVMLLGILGGPTANGIYDGGSKFVGVFRQFQYVISRAFYPFLARRKDKHSLFAKINIGVSVIGVSLLILFAPLLVRYMLNPDFSDSVIVLRILSLSLIFMALNNTYGTNYLIIYHHEKILRNNTIIASIIGMALAYPLINNFSYVGAAAVIVISRGLLGVFAFISAKKLQKKYDNH